MFEYTKTLNLKRYLYISTKIRYTTSRFLHDPSYFSSLHDGRDHSSLDPLLSTNVSEASAVDATSGPPSKGLLALSVHIAHQDI